MQTLSQLSYSPNGGIGESRTHGLLRARQALSQLSYDPIGCRDWI